MQFPNTQPNYRPDLDGLRAVAVSLVVLFHSQFSLFSGGFIGVDVFFVISGFVITRSITRELNQNTFTLSGFYLRRIRRILPAYFLVVLFTFVATSILFSPLEFKLFGQSVVASAMFLSNVLFWLQSGYFDAASELKPLLHTWSLAIEEQFYVIFPVVYAAIYSKVRARHLILFLAILSLLLSITFSSSFPTSAFYLLPFRVWELLLGALLVMYPISIRSKLLQNVLGLIGLIAIIGAAIFLTEASIFPGYLALFPCVGAALVIVSGNGISSWSCRLLSLPLLVLLGAISYSLYLWHWPIFLLMQYAFLDLRGFELPLVVVVAYVSYIFVENPIRAKRVLVQPKVLLGSMGSVLLTVVIAGFFVDESAGYPGRLSEAELELYQYASFYHSDPECHQASRISDASLCATMGFLEPIDIVFVGDSHADSLRPAFVSVSMDQDFNTLQFTDSGFVPLWGLRNLEYRNRDAELMQRLDVIIRERHPRLLVLNAYWSDMKSNSYSNSSGQIIGPDAMELGLSDLIGRYPDTEFLILGDVPSSEFFDPMYLLRLERFGASSIPAVSYESHLFLNSEINQKLENIAAHFDNAEFSDPAPQYCRDQSCVGSLEGEHLYRNADHLNPSGALVMRGYLTMQLSSYFH